MQRLVTVLLAVGCLITVADARGAELARNGELIRSMAIQNVSLATTPRQAFDTLRQQGFEAGDIDAFEDWTGSGIELVRSAGADGISRMVLGRRDGALVSISESWNRPAQPFDAGEYIDAARRHFGIGADEAACRAMAANSGACRVQDAEDPADVDLVWGLQILPGMLIRYVESHAAYAPE